MGKQSYKSNIRPHEKNSLNNDLRRDFEHNKQSPNRRTTLMFSHHHKQYDQIWRTFANLGYFKSIWQLFEDIFGIWQNLETYFGQKCAVWNASSATILKKYRAKFWNVKKMCCLAKFHCCKWPTLKPDEMCFSEVVSFSSCRLNVVKEEF